MCWGYGYVITDPPQPEPIKVESSGVNRGSDGTRRRGKADLGSLVGIALGIAVFFALARIDLGAYVHPVWVLAIAVAATVVSSVVINRSSALQTGIRFTMLIGLIVLIAWLVWLGATHNA